MNLNPPRFDADVRLHNAAAAQSMPAPTPTAPTSCDFFLFWTKNE